MANDNYVIDKYIATKPLELNYTYVDNFLHFLYSQVQIIKILMNKTTSF